MARIILFIAVFFAFWGCSVKESSLDKKLKEFDEVNVSVTEVDRVFYHPKKSRDVLKRFPFVSLRPKIDIKGKFPDEFYKNITFFYIAKNIKEVNYWELEKEPKSVDFIYVLPIWIKEYKDVSSDLFENIAYSYNLSKKEQDILKEWVKQGGVLWVEGGVYSTRYDMFTKSGEIAYGKIYRLVKRSLQNKHFLNYPIQTYLFKSKGLDFINYTPSYKEFRVYAKNSFFKDIKRLKLNLDNYLQNYFVIKSNPVLTTQNGSPVVSINGFKNGYLVTLLPFEYEDVYYDGELLRWRLLYYLLNIRK